MQTTTRNRLLTAVAFTGLSVSGLFFSGCQKEATPAGNPAPSAGGSAPAGATANSAAAQPRMKVDVEAVKTARILVRDTASQIGFMTDDAAFEKSVSGIDNVRGKIDIDASLRALDLVATLPDNPENQFIPLLSKAVAELRESFDLYKKSLAGGKPFSDGSDNGAKMAKLASDNSLNVIVSSDESLKLVDPK